MKTLERLDLVARKPHASDGRRVLVRATRKGIATMRRIFPRFNDIEALVTRNLSPEEKEELARTLRIMLHSCRKLTSRAGPRRRGQRPARVRIESMRMSTGVRISHGSRSSFMPICMPMRGGTMSSPMMMAMP